jgi:hypothetical protein
MGKLKQFVELKYRIAERSSNLLILAGLLISIATLNNCKKEEKNLPSLITIPASEITTNTAILGGIVGDDAGTDVISRGVCWGTEPNPAISGLNKNIIGNGTGIFKCTLTRLIPNTLFYVRAYATNSEGTAYGGEVKFTTSNAKAATVATIVNSDEISFYYARVGIHITDNGGTAIREKGICWATKENPTVVDNDKSICNDTNPDHDGYYWSDAGPLKPKTEYHVRAYADNGVGISYGDGKSFTTLAVPEVITLDATEITDSTATVEGKVTSIGDVQGDLEVGICYGTDKDPAINGHRIISDITGTGEFICNLTNLTPGTLYYVRTYVLWGVDWYFLEVYTEYGNEVTFNTH